MNPSKETRDAPDSYRAPSREDLERARVARGLLLAAGTPVSGSPLALDGDLPGGHHTWVVPRDHLLVATDHLVTLELAIEQSRHRSSTAPEFSLFTLVRGVFEAAAQAHWVLDPESAQERQERCRRVVQEDLEQAKKALGAIDASGTAHLDRLIQELSTSGTARWQSHQRLVAAAAPSINLDPDELVRLWRVASAAAHGNALFSAVAFETTQAPGPDGRLQTSRAAQPELLTEFIHFAVELTISGVERFLALARP